MALNIKIRGLSVKNRVQSAQDQSQLDHADVTVGIARALKHVQKETPTIQREAKAAIKDALIVIEKAIMGIDAVKDIRGLACRQLRPTGAQSRRKHKSYYHGNQSPCSGMRSCFPHCGFSVFHCEDFFMAGFTG